ncbi:MAG: RDD family protein [Verrucomicrobia bacterium Tous-C9LFEB]|nr:MAG: RDD family protein [Verrucomicrobia bacterium Tous-C9LFEB]
MNTLRIRTPEGVQFSLMLASPVTRGLALAIDLACISLVVSVLGVFLPIIGVISSDLANAIYVLSYFFISISYGILCEWLWHGQTLGKKILRLQVVDAQGLKLQFSQIVMRNLIRFVDCLPGFYLLGGMVCFLNGRVQRLGDFAAGTVVIQQSQLFQPNLDQVLPGKFNSFRKHPHLIARLRQSVPTALADLALQALLRRDQFDPAARVEIFSAIAAQFRTLVEFPENEVRDLPDEQYLRNVVDILFCNDKAVL